MPSPPLFAYFQSDLLQLLCVLTCLPRPWPLILKSPGFWKSQIFSELYCFCHEFRKCTLKLKSRERPALFSFPCGMPSLRLRAGMSLLPELRRNHRIQRNGWEEGKMRWFILIKCSPLHCFLKELWQMKISPTPELYTFLKEQIPDFWRWGAMCHSLWHNAVFSLS